MDSDYEKPESEQSQSTVYANIRENCALSFPRYSEIKFHNPLPEFRTSVLSQPSSFITIFHEYFKLGIHTLGQDRRRNGCTANRLKLLSQQVG